MGYFSVPFILLSSVYVLLHELPEIYIPPRLCGLVFHQKKKRKNTAPHRQKNSHLPVLRPYLSVIPWFLVLKGWQAFQTSSSPSKKYPSSCHNLTIPPPPHPHPSWARQTKIESEWSESGLGSYFADQSVDTWLSLTGRPFNPIVSPTGLLSVVPLSLWLRAGERPD